MKEAVLFSIELLELILDADRLGLLLAQERSQSYAIKVVQEGIVCAWRIAALPRSTIQHRDEQQAKHAGKDVYLDLLIRPVILRTQAQVIRALDTLETELHPRLRVIRSDDLLACPLVPVRHQQPDPQRLLQLLQGLRVRVELDLPLVLRAAALPTDQPLHELPAQDLRHFTLQFFPRPVFPTRTAQPSVQVPQLLQPFLQIVLHASQLSLVQFVGAMHHDRPFASPQFSFDSIVADRVGQTP